MQLAVKAGASRLLLIGFDMRSLGNGDGIKTHWFGDHPDKMRSDYAGTMLCNFPSLVEPLKARGVEVVNCSPGSALDCFEMGELETVL